MLHFDFAPNPIDYELRTNKRQRRSHDVNAPPEIEKEKIVKSNITLEQREMYFLTFSIFILKK